MTMNNKRAIAVRKRQREAPTIRTADNDQKPAKKATPTAPPKRQRRSRVGITLAPMPIGRIDD